MYGRESRSLDHHGGAAIKGARRDDDIRPLQQGTQLLSLVHRLSSELHRCR
jgi:hypothetical protein